jgi:repressor of nif and glnA expression
MDNKNCIYELLSIVKVYTDKNLGVGRNRIEKELNAFGIDISENEIRRIINELNKEGLLISNKGRAGTVVTQRGKKFINWLDNR